MQTGDCKVRRYRYSAERDCLEMKSPSGKIITVYALSCKDMEGYRKFSNMIQDVDQKGEFITESTWYPLSVTYSDMKEFLELSKKQKENNHENKSFNTNTKCRRKL